VRDFVGATSGRQDGIGRSLENPRRDFIDLTEFSLGRVKLEFHVPAINIAKLPEALEKGGYEAFPGVPLLGVDELADRHDEYDPMDFVGRPRPQWPQRGNNPAANQGDDHAPSHATIPLDWRGPATRCSAIYLSSGDPEREKDQTRCGFASAWNAARTGAR